MLKAKYSQFSFAELGVIALLIVYAYVTHPEHATSAEVMAIVLAFAGAIAVTNAALFFENRNIAWSNLRFSRKAFFVLVAIATASLALCVALSCLRLLGMTIGMRSLLSLTAMGGISFGVIGLAGFHLINGGICSEDDWNNT